MNTDTPTPRTDAETSHRNDAYEYVNPPCWEWVVPSDFARTLERELTQANECIATLKGAWDIDTADHCKRAASNHLTIERLSAELASARARIAELEGELAKLSSRPGLDCSICGARITHDVLQTPV